MMGSGSTNPCPENENVRVCRPITIPQSDPGISRPSLSSPSPVSINEPDHNILLKTMTEHYNQFLKSATQLNGSLKPRALEGGADAGSRLEITRLESKNTELTAAIRVLTEELAGALQELANSNPVNCSCNYSWKKLEMSFQILGSTDLLPTFKTR
ncbi:hypothetical protein MKW92_007500 [Papaver armeniacum]|nr:hypothetical protein MKW92_007500 [Papaver armeniacum]